MLPLAIIKSFDYMNIPFYSKLYRHTIKYELLGAFKMHMQGLGM